MSNLLVSFLPIKHKSIKLNVLKEFKRFYTTNVTTISSRGDKEESNQFIDEESPNFANTQTIYWLNNNYSNNLETALIKRQSLDPSLTNDNSNIVLDFRKILTDAGISVPIPKVYKPSQIEPAVQKAWETLANMYYSSQKPFATAEPSEYPSFVACLPPINVTGNLHLGHSLACTILDSLTRWNRMNSRNVIWIPGFDHAGIATEVKVEQNLLSNTSLQQSRLTLGRTRFLSHCEAWKNMKMSEITNQLKKLGLHLGWDSSSSSVPYTLDKNFEELVTWAFCEFNRQGWIYRSNRLVNWCFQLQTSISDLEIDRVRLSGPTFLNVPLPIPGDTTSVAQKLPIKFGQMWAIRYPCCDSSSYVTVHTSLPQTIPNDIAIVAHPYFRFRDASSTIQHSDSTKVLNPLSPFVNCLGKWRRPGNCSNNAPIYLPIIYDERVDPNKGSGYVKLTPAHSNLDYDIYMDHKREIRTAFAVANSHLDLEDQDLDQIFDHLASNSIYDRNGFIETSIPNGPNAKNNDTICLDRYETRNLFLHILNTFTFTNGNKEIPYFDSYYDFPGHCINLCSRTGDVVEQLPKPQWYLDCKKLNKLVLDTYLKPNKLGGSRLLDILPRDSKLYGMEDMIRWFEKDEEHDWCLSRQIWWGHQIPAFYCSDERLNTKLHDAIKNFPTSSKSSRDNDGPTPPEIHSFQGRTYIVAPNAKEAANLCQKFLQSKIKEVDIQTNLIDESAFEQDEDVFDTWFSSALYPIGIERYLLNGTIIDLKLERSKIHHHNSLASNNDSILLQDNKLEPALSILETGYDIRHLWVNRMLLLCTYLRGRLPFHQILYHGLVNDSHGRKMSKSLGNVIDPIHVIEGSTLNELKANILSDVSLSTTEREKAIKGQKSMFPRGIPECGADALRFALLHNDIKAQIVKVDVNRMDEYRKFGNKIWQAFRYFTLMIEETIPSGINKSCLFVDIQNNFKNKSPPVNLEDFWILSKLYNMICVCNSVFTGDDSCPVKSTTRNIEKYDFHRATEALKHFWIKEFCDVYIEITKLTLKNAETPEPCAIASSLRTLYFCINLFLRSLHPFMPHLTEALWFYLGNTVQETTQQQESFKSRLPIGLMSYPLPQHISSMNFDSLTEFLDELIYGFCPLIRYTLNCSSFNKNNDGDTKSSLDISTGKATLRKYSHLKLNFSPRYLQEIERQTGVKSSEVERNLFKIVRALLRNISVINTTNSVDIRNQDTNNISSNDYKDYISYELIE